MRSVAFFVVTACAAAATHVAISETERGFGRSMREAGSRVPAPEPELEPAILPWADFETASATGRGSAGKVYEVRAKLHQLVGESYGYLLDVDGLPEGVEIVDSTLVAPPPGESVSLFMPEAEGSFSLTLTIPEGLESGAYPFNVRLFNGMNEVMVSKVILPVRRLIDEIRIAAYNDFHGYIIPQGNAEKGYTGALSMSFAIDQLSKDREFILVGAGDTIGGSLFESAMNNDDPSKEIAKLWGTDVQALGNHEFDKGWEDVLDAAQKFGFPQLGANIHRTVDNSLFTEAVYMKEVTVGSNTYKIGFVGVTLESLPMVVLASAVEGLAFSAPGPIAVEEARKLKNDENCDVVICLYHQGGSSDSTSIDDYMAKNPSTELTAFLEAIKDSEDIDVLMTGHTHQVYAWQESAVHSRLPPLIQTGSFGVNLAVFDLQLDTASHEVTIKPVVNQAVKQSKTFDFITGKWMDGSTEMTQDEIAALPTLVTNVLEIVKTAKEKADVLGQEKLAKSNITWPKPGNDETILGAHIADAMLDVAVSRRPEIQVAITNNGGIRAPWSPVDGHILVRHVYDTLPFSNSAMVMQLKGETLKTILETQWTASTSKFMGLSIAGIRYDFEEQNADHNRVSNMEVFDAARNTWSTVEMDQPYWVVTNNFLAGGGDSFGGFLEYLSDPEDLGVVDNEYTRDYNVKMAAENNGWLVPPTYERAINKDLDATDDLFVTETVVYVGDDVHISVSFVATKEVQGPFRAVWYHSGLEETKVELITQEAITPSTPLVVRAELKYGPVPESEIQFGLYHERFDGSPLPRGIQRTFRLEPRTEGSGVPMQFQLMGAMAGGLILLAA
eukprot:Protomagalhaensia_sp_Gyna_25__5425@NODE_706_length_2802_cov_79_238147_g551_i0_p1_GENE_NODE_706_length_2802_cov_79_238147_g551_i0NODE_706_length_2802_cov_79_238147_g551_i0_p1_ORF_typecomplete_len849_score163_785_nucleotid_C/PF02872_18/9_8e28Metallophos/PF00149_28/0_00028Metallophos_2/PF12850_7/0_012Aldolase_II/PF00596_21/0_044NPCBM_assoc/PF10633_9/0_26Kelch_1/PF01344_25/2_7e03Kelch_1/PF01344_25/1_NODE_706_length_2802_cov_79_238147_g551_i02552777